MSARFSINGKDVKSAVRHTVIPLLSGAAVAGLEAVQAGGVEPGQVKTAIVSAFVAGLIRFLQRWTSSMPEVSSR